MARPQWATMKVRKNTPDRLELDYHPLAYLLLGGVMVALLLYVGPREVMRGNLREGLIAIGAAVFFALGIGFAMYRRVQVVFDRTAGEIRHVETVLYFMKKRTRHALADLTGVREQTSFTGDTALHRVALQFGAAEVPLTRAYISGPNMGEMTEVIRDWAKLPPEPSGGQDPR